MPLQSDVAGWAKGDFLFSQFLFQNKQLPLKRVIMSRSLNLAFYLYYTFAAANNCYVLSINLSCQLWAWANVCSKPHHVIYFMWFCYLFYVVLLSSVVCILDFSSFCSLSYLVLTGKLYKIILMYSLIHRLLLERFWCEVNNLILPEMDFLPLVDIRGFVFFYSYRYKLCWCCTGRL